MNRFAFLFPGQGAQYVGMGKDFVGEHKEAALVLEQAEDLLKMQLKKLLFESTDEELVRTDRSQLAIFVVSAAILAAIQKVFPALTPEVCSGLSLGEYTALLASKKASFEDVLFLVKTRGELMQQACLKAPGTMAVVMGLDVEQVRQIVGDLALPEELFVANLNCPGQVVISGTLRAIEKAKCLAQERGAKRVVALDVAGAFHSGLMRSARLGLGPYIENLKLSKSKVGFVMNRVGDFVENEEDIRKFLEEQITNSVLWEKGVKNIATKGVNNFLEIGPGRTLTGMNKRIGVEGNCMNVENLNDLTILEKYLT